MDHEERTRKKEARMVHKRAKFAQKVHGLRAKLFQKKRYKEKAAMRKTIKQHQEKDNKHKNKEQEAVEGAKWKKQARYVMKGKKKYESMQQ